MTTTPTPPPWRELKDEYPTIGDEWQGSDGKWYPVETTKTSIASHFHPVKFRRPTLPAEPASVTWTPKTKYDNLNLATEIAHELNAKSLLFHGTNSMEVRNIVFEVRKILLKYL